MAIISKFHYRWNGYPPLASDGLVLVICLCSEAHSANFLVIQSVKTTESGGPRGFDAANLVKGHKRHILADTGGLLVTGMVHAAHIQDRDGAPPLLASIRTAFPWLRAQELAVDGHMLWAFRMSYAGELGWELHCSRQQLPRVYQALWQAGQSCGLSNYGSFAMNAMRLEKMFKGAGELTNEVTLAEADVMRFVKLDKPDFIGKTATEVSVSGDLPWICAYLEVDDDGLNDGHGGEAVLARGECIGTVSSIAYGFSVEKLLAFAYLKPQ